MTYRDIILAHALGKGKPDVEVESLSVTANSTYTAPEGKAYSPVNVNVPNTYAAGDEGKVVSNGALVAQTSDSVTENGTVDTTLINSLEVNVSGAQNVATGTIDIEEQTTTADNLTITHNLGRVPVGLAWIVADEDPSPLKAIPVSGVVSNTIAGEYITPTSYIYIRASSNNSESLTCKKVSSAYVFNSLSGNETTIKIFAYNSNRPVGHIPPNTKIRWFVW